VGDADGKRASEEATSRDDRRSTGLKADSKVCFLKLKGFFLTLDTNSSCKSYADMEEDDGAQEAIDEEDRQRKLAKKFGKQDEDDDDNDDGIGAREGAAAANGSAGAEGDADGVQRKARGTRGNKEAKRKKKEQKKKEQEEELKRKKEEKKKKIGISRSPISQRVPASFS